MSSGRYDTKKVSFLYVTDLSRKFDGDTSHIVVKGTFKPKGVVEPYQYKAVWFDMDEVQTIACSLKVEGFWIDAAEVVIPIIQEEREIFPVNRVAQSLGQIWSSNFGEVARADGNRNAKAN